VNGLQSKPEFNGRQAMVLNYDATKGRYSAELDGVKVSLKRGNLTPVLDKSGQPVFA